MQTYSIGDAKGEIDLAKGGGHYWYLRSTMERERAPPEVDDMTSHQLRSFGILLGMSQGSRIYNLLDHKGLENGRLPVLREPSDLPLFAWRDLWTAFRQKR